MSALFNTIPRIWQYFSLLVGIPFLLNDGNKPHFQRWQRIILTNMSFSLFSSLKKKDKIVTSLSLSEYYVSTHILGKLPNIIIVFIGKQVLLYTFHSLSHLWLNIHRALINIASSSKWTRPWSVLRLPIFSYLLCFSKSFSPSHQAYNGQWSAQFQSTVNDRNSL